MPATNPVVFVVTVIRSVAPTVALAVRVIIARLLGRAGFHANGNVCGPDG